MRTDDEVREIMDKACAESAGKYLREFAEEVISMRQRIRRLEQALEIFGIAASSK
jgi:hypothetical protein